MAKYSVTQACRDVDALQPVAQKALRLLFQECYKAGITDVFVTETLREQERQNYLYAQGRTRPGNVVTWTLNSNHTPGLAWDIAVAPPKGLYDKTTIDRVGAIAGKLGIEWGGTWKAPNYDAPHFQVSKNWTMPKGYALGEVFVPTKSSERISIKNVPNTAIEGELTMAQYDELKKEIAELKALLGQKLDKVEAREVLAVHKEDWEWLKANGITDGSNPQNFVTREQVATLIKKYDQMQLKR